MSWHKEPRRHSLSARGIKNATNNNYLVEARMQREMEVKNSNIPTNEDGTFVKSGVSVSNYGASMYAKEIEEKNKIPKKYFFYDDPAHAWLKVEKSELERLGILNDISQYSYIKGDYVYLEEDMDATSFIEAKEKFGEKVEFENVSTDNRSKIRSYDSFRPNVKYYIGTELKDKKGNKFRVTEYHSGFAWLYNEKGGLIKIPKDELKNYKQIVRDEENGLLEK